MKVVGYDRGHVEIEDAGKRLVIEGEMLRVGNRMGFTLYMQTAVSWNTRLGTVNITSEDRGRISAFLQSEFERMDRVLDLVFEL